MEREGKRFSVGLDKSTQVQVSATGYGKRNLKIYLCNRMQQRRYGI